MWWGGGGRLETETALLVSFCLALVPGDPLLRENGWAPQHHDKDLISHPLEERKKKRTCKIELWGILFVSNLPFLSQKGFWNLFPLSGF